MSLLVVPAGILLYSVKSDQSIVGTVDIDWNVPIEQNVINYNNPGTFSLIANHTYKLEAFLTLVSVTEPYLVRWVDSSNIALPTSSVGFGDTDDSSSVFAIYRPLVDTIVKVQLTIGGAGLTVSQNSLVSIVAIN